MPSQDPTAPIHCIHKEDLHLDLFTERDKPYYAKYKVGVQELPPTHSGDVDWEQDLLQQGVQELQRSGRPERYLREVNQAIATRVLSSTLTETAVHLPAPPSTDEESRVPVPHPEALPVACTNPPRRLGAFNIPPSKRRLTHKNVSVYRIPRGCLRPCPKRSGNIKWSGPCRS